MKIETSESKSAFTASPTLESHDSQSQTLYTGKDVKLRYDKTKQTKHESTNAQASCHRRLEFCW